jgi:hypothetical protein
MRLIWPTSSTARLARRITSRLAQGWVDHPPLLAHIQSAGDLAWDTLRLRFTLFRNRTKIARPTWNLTCAKSTAEAPAVCARRLPWASEEVRPRGGPWQISLGRLLYPGMVIYHRDSFSAARARVTDAGSDMHTTDVKLHETTVIVFHVISDRL